MRQSNSFYDSGLMNTNNAYDSNANQHNLPSLYKKKSSFG